MDNVVWINSDTPSKIMVNEDYITWNSRKKRLTFPWEDVIGSKIGLSQKYFTAMVFYRNKDKFKVFRFKHSTHLAALALVEKIGKVLEDSSKKIAVFLNPISGNGKSLEVYNGVISNLLDYCRCPYKVFEISSAEYLNQFDMQELLDFNQIVCVGGDGTMHQLLSALSNSQNLSNFSFCIIPTGSQNALSCELYGKSLNSALLSIVKGKKRTCGLLKVTLEDGRNLIATTAVSWGLVSEITEEAQRYRIFGPLRYDITSFFKVFQTWKRYSCEITTEEKSVKGEYICVLVGKNKAQSTVAGDLMVFPKADICDEFLDIQTFDYSGKWKTVKVFNNMRKGGLHIKSKKVHYWKDQSVNIAANNHFVFNIDGEIYHTPSVQIQVLINSITYLIL